MRVAGLQQTQTAHRQTDTQTITKTRRQTTSSPRAVARPRPSGGHQPFLWRLIAQRSRSPDRTEPQLTPAASRPQPSLDRASAVIIIKLLLWHTNRLYCSRVIVRQCFQLVVSLLPPGSSAIASSGSGSGSATSSFCTNEKCCGLFSFTVFPLRRRRSKHNLLH